MLSELLKQSDNLLVLKAEPSEKSLVSCGPDGKENPLNSLDDAKDRVKLVVSSFTGTANTNDEEIGLLSVDQESEYGHHSRQLIDVSPYEFHALSRILQAMMSMWSVGIFVWSHRGFWYFIVYLWCKSTGKKITKGKSEALKTTMENLLGVHSLSLLGIQSQSTAYIYGDIVLRFRSSILVCSEGKRPFNLPADCQYAFIDHAGVSATYLENFTGGGPFEFYLSGPCADAARRGKKIPVIITESESTLTYFTAMGGIAGAIFLTGSGNPCLTSRVVLDHLARTGHFSFFYVGDLNPSSYHIMLQYKGSKSDSEYCDAFAVEDIHWATPTPSDIQTLGFTWSDVATEIDPEKDYYESLVGEEALAAADDIGDLKEMRKLDGYVDFDTIVQHAGIRNVAELLAKKIYGIMAREAAERNV